MYANLDQVHNTYSFINKQGNRSLTMSPINTNINGRHIFIVLQIKCFLKIVVIIKQLKKIMIRFMIMLIL